MKLSKVRITNFQSIQDSTEFDIGCVTCLVGKNEAGKTALLKALYRLNSIIENEGQFDPTDDFPRSSVSDYEEDVNSGSREQATVVQATYKLDSDDIAAVKSIYGPSCFSCEAPTVTLCKGYGNQLEATNLDINFKESLSYLIEAADLPQQIASDLKKLNSVDDMIELLSGAEQTEAVQSLDPILSGIADVGINSFIFTEILENSLPKFLYFDEYYQLRGQDNLEQLKQRVNNNNLKESDHPLLGLIELAGLNLDELVAPRRTETLIARLEAAENRLTQKVLTYWSQNKHLRMKFDIRQAQPGDDPGMTSGTNIWGRVQDTRHMVSTPLGSRSRGFVWFFSFLAWYSKLQRQNQKLILLLDEPGLSLHAKAQGDLLRYFEKELKPHHQLLYTTHSPFMIDTENFDCVRIVQDLSIETDLETLPEGKQGTKVSIDVLEATSDSLFPLQAALGYEIHQALFIGPNCLVVEGVSDLLYLQALSAVLQRRGQHGLSSDWTITPVGSISNVSTFVALIGAKTNLNVAVLVDFQKRDHQIINNLYKSKLLKKQQVMTFADFTGTSEADIEDMFDPDFYLKLVNCEFGLSLEVCHLSSTRPRILQRIKEHLEKHPLPSNAHFNHYRPARYLNENCESLESELTHQSLDRFQQAFDTLNQLL